MTIQRIFLILTIAIPTYFSSSFSSAQSLSSLTPIIPVTRPGPGDEKCAKPVYPKSSLRNEEQGNVTVSYLIDSEGAILDSKIVKSSGFPELDKETMYSIAKCKFTLPPGKTEPVWVQITYKWSLR